MGDIPHEWAEWLKAKGYSVPVNPWDLYQPTQGRQLAFPAEHSDTAFMTDQVLEYLTNVRLTLSDPCMLDDY
jgi:hypothetical protein